MARPPLLAVLPLRHRPTFGDPALLLLTGTVVAGVCAALLTRANGVSQLYFLYAAWPAIVVLVAWGLVEGTRRAALRPVVVALAATGGVAVTLAVRTLATPTAPDPPLAGALLLGRALLPGWVLLGLGVLAVTAALVSASPRARRSAGTWTVAGVVAASALTGAASATRVQELGTALRELGSPVVWQGEGVGIAPDLADAARLVRDSSGPDDVVATNAHCFGSPGSCDARHFAVSALSERRVLVEGWAYPDGRDPDREWSRTNPFWDEKRYAENEVVFTAPTRADVEHLRDAYGVRWLVVDRTVAPEDPTLRQYAELVWERPGAAVYRIDG